MAVEIQAVHNPIHANRFPAKILNAPTVPVRALLPMANSAITRGTDHTKRKISHGTRKEPPPLAPTIRGNRQMFPVPTAAPMVAKISPIRPPKVSPDISLKLPSIDQSKPLSFLKKVNHVQPTTPEVGQPSSNRNLPAFLIFPLLLQQFQFDLRLHHHH